MNLDELDRMLAAATPGPWKEGWDSRPYPRDGFPWSTFAIGPQHGMPQAPYNDDAKEAIRLAGERRNADATLIAALHNAAPALIAELREARATIARLTEERDAALLRGVRAGLRAAATECLEVAREYDDPDGGFGSIAADDCKARVAALDPHAIAAEAAQEKP